jgi:UDP-N-acetylglucosamine 2-epimerase (non-hydrolysing)
MASALAAFYAGVPVVHVEAGLRTGTPTSPFPEELNRRLTTVMSSLHLAATAGARQNLLAEGVDPSSVVVTGNTVIDALLETVGRENTRCDEALEALFATGRRIIAVTAHRRESWGESMVGIGRALGTIASEFSDVEIVFPIHRNPIVREAIAPGVDGHRNVHIIEPLPYGEFCRLLARSHLVLTDSGGVQEEAPALGKPVLVMRESTERPEAIEAGSAILVGTSETSIVDSVSKLLTSDEAYAAMANAVNPYGDGHACPRSVHAIERLLGYRSDPPREFLWKS